MSYNKKQKTENSFKTISTTEYFMDKIKNEMKSINNEHKPFVHGRNSPFMDIAKQNGRVSPFDNNGIFIKDNETKNRKQSPLHDI